MHIKVWCFDNTTGSWAAVIGGRTLDRLSRPIAVAQVTLPTRVKWWERDKPWERDWPNYTGYFQSGTCLLSTVCKRLSKVWTQVQVLPLPVHARRLKKHLSIYRGLSNFSAGPHFPLRTVWELAEGKLWHLVLINQNLIEKIWFVSEDYSLFYHNGMIIRRLWQNINDI